MNYAEQESDCDLYVMPPVSVAYSDPKNAAVCCLAIASDHDVVTDQVIACGLVKTSCGGQGNVCEALVLCVLAFPGDLVSVCDEYPGMVCAGLDPAHEPSEWYVVLYWTPAMAGLVRYQLWILLHWQLACDLALGSWKYMWKVMV